MSEKKKSNFPPLVRVAMEACREHNRELGTDQLGPHQTDFNNTYVGAWLDAFHFLQKHPEVLTEFPALPGYVHFPKEK